MFITSENSARTLTSQIGRQRAQGWRKWLGGFLLFISACHSRPAIVSINPDQPISTIQTPEGYTPVLDGDSVIGFQTKQQDGGYPIETISADSTIGSPGNVRKAMDYLRKQKGRHTLKFANAAGSDITGASTGTLMWIGDFGDFSDSGRRFVISEHIKRKKLKPEGDSGVDSAIQFNHAIRTDTTLLRVESLDTSISKLEYHILQLGFHPLFPDNGIYKMPYGFDGDVKWQKVDSAGNFSEDTSKQLKVIR